MTTSGQGRAWVQRVRLLQRVAQLLQPPTQVLWLQAPMGMGKTVLARQWLGAAASSLTKATPLLQPLTAGESPLAAWQALWPGPAHGNRVLDNLHLAGPEAAWAPALASRIEALPPGARLLMLSRRAPPAAFARLQLQQRLAVLGGDALRLDAEEAAAAGLPAAADGWPAAGGLPADEAAAAPLLAALIEAEVLAGLDPADRLLLQQLAWLPGSVDTAAAAALSGRADALLRLQQLCDQGLLAERSGARVQLHAVLRRHLKQGPAAAAAA
jgi:ATP/maltotriose-dependent transcriptional regulator MalT